MAGNPFPGLPSSSAALAILRRKVVERAIDRACLPHESAVRLTAAEARSVAAAAVKWSGTPLPGGTSHLRRLSAVTVAAAAARQYDLQPDIRLCRDGVVRRIVSPIAAPVIRSNGRSVTIRFGTQV